MMSGQHRDPNEATEAMPVVPPPSGQEPTVAVPIVVFAVVIAFSAGWLCGGLAAAPVPSSPPVITPSVQVIPDRYRLPPGAPTSGAPAGLDTAVPTY